MMCIMRLALHTISCCYLQSQLTLHYILQHLACVSVFVSTLTPYHCPRWLYLSSVESYKRISETLEIN